MLYSTSAQRRDALDTVSPPRNADQLSGKLGLTANSTRACPIRTVHVVLPYDGVFASVVEF